MNENEEGELLLGSGSRQGWVEALHASSWATRGDNQTPAPVLVHACTMMQAWTTPRSPSRWESSGNIPLMLARGG